MVNIRKSIVLKACVFLLCLVVITACSNNGNNVVNKPEVTNTNDTSTNTTVDNKDETPTAPDLPEVKLVFNYPVPNAPGADQKLVEDEINKYLKEKINATVELNPLTFDEYEPRMNTMMAAGEDIDIAWSARGWLMNYQPNIDKGAFLELTDDMIQQYAPDARANIPDKFWPDLLANDGKVYGFPIFQIAAKTKSLIIQKQFIDKYKLDVSTISTYKDIEPFLKTLKDNEPDIIPLGLAQNSWGLYSNRDHVSADGLRVGYKKDDPNFTMINSFDTLDSQREYFDTMHSWYEAGYINEDAALVANINDLKAKGNVAVALEFTSKPGGEVDEMGRNGGNEVVYVPISDSYFTGVSGAMHVVLKSSENPERALMLINLLNTDEYLYNLICFGIEDKHYKKMANNYIEQIADSGYAPNADWVFGNQFNAYLKGNQAPDVWEKTVELNDKAMVSEAYGFSVDETDIASEVANLTTTNNEYQIALHSGTVDPKEILPDYIAKLKANGQEKVDQEVAEQYDAFLKAKGKR